MSNNITTVPMLPDAEGVGTEDTLYLIQGTGSDRDRKATLSDVFDGVLPHKIDSGYDYGDVTFGYEESRGGKILTGNIRNKQVTADKLADGSVNGWKLDETSAFTGKSFYGTETVSAPSVKATTEIKTPTIEGTTAGTSSSYLLVNSAMTVNGDADLKSNVNLGENLMVVSQDDQKVTVNGDLSVSGNIDAGSGTTTRSYTNQGGLTTTRTDAYDKTVFNSGTGESSVEVSASRMTVKGKEHTAYYGESATVHGVAASGDVSVQGTGSFTGTLTAKGAMSVGGTLSVSGDASIDGNIAIGNAIVGKLGLSTNDAGSAINATMYTKVTDDYSLPSSTAGTFKIVHNANTTSGNSVKVYLTSSVYVNLRAYNAAFFLCLGGKNWVAVAGDMSFSTAS